MHGIVIHCREDLGDPIMGDQLLADDLVSEEFTFDRWPLLSGKNLTLATIFQTGPNWKWHQQAGDSQEWGRLADLMATAEVVQSKLGSFHIKKMGLEN